MIFSTKAIAVIEHQLYSYFINSSGIMHSSWSPVRMDIFPALEEKIDFFLKNGYYDAAKRAIYKMLKISEKYLHQMSKTKYNAEFTPLIHCKCQIAQNYQSLLPMN